MIKIFANQKKELKSDIDTWIVKYTTYKKGISLQYPNDKICYQAFTDKNEATEYKESLMDAMKLLGITSLPEPEMYLQERNSL